MRIVLDSNILVSSLISSLGPSAQLRNAWQEGKFELVACRQQVERLQAVLMRKKFAALFQPSDAAKLIEDIHAAALLVEPRPGVAASPDPEDNIILGAALAASADLLVTGDKGDLLVLKQVAPVELKKSLAHSYVRL